MGIVRRDIRRIADDDVEASRGNGIEPIAEHELDIVYAQPLRIAARDIERGNARINRNHTSLRPFVRDGERDRTGTCTEIGDVHFFALWTMQQCDTNEQFGVFARDQHVRRDMQIERPELATSNQISDRLARRSPRR